jgi:hypothetical protein
MHGKRIFAKEFAGSKVGGGARANNIGPWGGDVDDPCVRPLPTPVVSRNCAESDLGEFWSWSLFPRSEADDATCEHGADAYGRSSVPTQRLNESNHTCTKNHHILYQIQNQEESTDRSRNITIRISDGIEPSHHHRAHRVHR